MKKLICFSLWGKQKKYTVGAVKNADLALSIYPDWVCRYYVGSSVPRYTVEKLRKRKNTEVFLMNEPGDWTSMFWRFYPASEQDVECMLSRDTDSRLTVRERDAVEEWLASDKGFHIMRDHPYHATEILGGMWGVKRGVIPEMKNMIDRYIKGDFWQVDQNFLKEVYPLIRDNAFVHDPFFEKKRFPTSRAPGQFVGQALNADDTMCEPSHAQMVKGVQ